VQLSFSKTAFVAIHPIQPNKQKQTSNPYQITLILSQQQRHASLISCTPRRKIHLLQTIMYCRRLCIAGDYVLQAMLALEQYRTGLCNALHRLHESNA
jgi:hypothetical protein